MRRRVSLGKCSTPARLSRAKPAARRRCTTYVMPARDADHRATPGSKRVFRESQRVVCDRTGLTRAQILPAASRIDNAFLSWFSFLFLAETSAYNTA